MKYKLAQALNLIDCIQHIKFRIMKKSAIITLIVLAGCVNVCSTVLFYQEAGRIVKEQLFSTKATTYSFTTNNLTTNLTYNGLVEKVTATIETVFNMPQTTKTPSSCSCPTRI